VSLFCVAEADGEKAEGMPGQCWSYGRHESPKLSWWLIYLSLC